MVAYIILSTLLLFILLGSLRLSGDLLLSPVPLALLGLLVSLVLATIGLGSWNHVSLGWETTCVVTLGAVSLLVGATLAGRLCDAHGVKSLERTPFSSVHATTVWKYALIVTILILAIVVRVVETYRIGAELGVDLSSYSEVASAVRSSLAGFNSSEGIRVGVGFSFVERQLEKVATVVGFISVYLLAKGITGHGLTDIVGSASLLFLACCFCYVAGSRGTVMLYGVAFASVLFVMLLRNGKSPSGLAARFFVVGLIVCCVAAVFFYLSGSLVGRSASSGLVEYISFYFGCGAPAFQQLLDSGNLSAFAPGVRTFYYLFSVPYKLGLIDVYPSYSIAWLDMGGHACNIFTGFARYYLDFGLAGVVLLSVCSGAFMTFIYKMAMRWGNPFLVVFAGYLCAYAFDLAREEFVFSRLISPTQFVSVALMVLVTLFLTTSLSEDLKYVRGLLAKRRAA